ncbi:glutamine--fructose-6-phosphate transaminase (isomerizing) [Candidatus Woesearchaeota archaeon]|jgi:glutamine---fructose-6-phosphate transaminase (isomerizing)|nr:glutamine--fructose-6-phosphate transaminase (isomerizing) [Candidatus Woesearchaeota archaeon]MBT5273083.1 glutamine--fructose-6-phosphate transaminase (isomerizing) [Candidatus Woesearchaeota archaeon]MBT6337602.1 glutamine--fructose-6-phosphate transaminase (isomerizing) [Candidatus Woesearchaeota archaeon]MBT7926997.1 glutamine--fructose-6-phosphate transaminase (isomerizing) [Candidatus Woesearchaeota archaeon]
MCGIIGIVSKDGFSVKNTLLKSLKRLEYRGYDSSGYVTGDGELSKRTGEIDPLIASINESTTTKVAISHSRWATHGGVTKTNAHPHFNTDKTIFAVHNGILENFQELKTTLTKKGYKFISETDTEVIPHYFDDQLKQGNDMHQAIKNFMSDVRGTFAILLIKKDDNQIYAIKRDSPLVLGLAENKFILASDIYAFSDETNKAIFFEDNEYALISEDKYEFFNVNGKPITKKIMEFEWTREDETMEHYPHYMIKEIKEQPSSSLRLINSFETIQNNKLNKLADLMKNTKRIVFLACGTSYHASLIGSILLSDLGIYTRSIIASEADSFVKYDEKTLCIAISQSGETMDVVSQLKKAKKAGAKIASLVNVPFSTIQRLSDVSIEILAGQEVCVAATKTFTNQVIVMLELAKRLGYKIDLKQIPKKIQQTIAINEDKVKEMSIKLSKKRDIFVLGKGMSYPMAREIALKLKEIDYIHAEGMMAGELKHGTIALIDKDVPVISLIPNGNEEMISATQEVKARGAWIIKISNVEGKGDLIVPKCDEAEFAIYSGIVGHLMSYHIGVILKREIDKPRNLAKSVTVK